ncbi:N-fatty-acyl-amino acid synthase/hydrolase PM20D1-like [Haliotis rufescens]|uniref:N-fatty-acyl-amino acid synthase/hydrolase PM20D1-like n=1 Tax=Haliotis rufescens TaxID=6454 RepID=UPI00201F3DE3|nr:N-fatty-acyl-amino acid synthase/hydrolase PM20D1-like [Haliotis rufescens]
MAASTCRLVLTISCSVFFVLTAIVLIRTFTLSVRIDNVQICDSKDEDFVEATDEIIQRFKKALRFKTVSKEKGIYDRDELLKMQNFIISAFPAVHSSPLVEFEVVNNYSLFYFVKGTNETLTPYMLASHLDVVPAEPEKWEVPPFSADIKDGFIYGRGAIDDKHGVMAILETMEFLLKRGFQPQRSFYVGFGHDEEVAGTDGAAAIAERLTQKGVRRLEFLSDEGLCVLDGIVPGMKTTTSMIGTSEKGQVILRLRVKGSASHSSMPPRESSIGILARAVHRLETVGHPSMFGHGPEKDMFEHLASQMYFPHRMIMSNLWLFTPVVSWMLSRKPSSNAVLRTVTSVTQFQAGIKDNVMPPEAVAIVNHRIHPAQTVQEVIDYDRKLINDDRVQIEVKYSQESLPLSPYGPDDFGYQVIKNSIRQVWKDTIVAPGVMIGNTDTRHYINLTNNIYRFSPTYMYPEDLARFHGDNERISVKNYEQAINFFYHLIQNADKPGLQLSHSHSEL